MLSGSDIPMLEVARRVARSHHERWDGSGYPDGLAGEDIPIEARIMLIADVYDSLVHERHFREPWQEDEGTAYMRERRGTWFDPELLDLFLENIALMRAIRLGNPD
jgi:response regulator RpfG family c-di-GMP phosphodiesterase